MSTWIYVVFRVAPSRRRPVFARACALRFRGRGVRVKQICRLVGGQWMEGRWFCSVVMRANARARTKTPNPAIDEIDTTARAAIWNGGRAGVCVCGRAKDLISDNFLVCQSGGLWCVAWRCGAYRMPEIGRMMWANKQSSDTERTYVGHPESSIFLSHNLFVLSR